MMRNRIIAKITLRHRGIPKKNTTIGNVIQLSAMRTLILDKTRATKDTG